MAKTITMTATKIAEAGAAKMSGQGYTFKLFPMSKVAGHVVKADGTRYKVNLHTGKCSCPFHKDNATCKHLVWLKAELEWEASHEAEFTARDEYETFGKYLTA